MSQAKTANRNKKRRALVTTGSNDHFIDSSPDEDRDTFTPYLNHQSSEISKKRGSEYDSENQELVQRTNRAVSRYN